MATVGNAHFSVFFFYGEIVRTCGNIPSTTYALFLIRQLLQYTSPLVRNKYLDLTGLTAHVSSIVRDGK